MAKDTRLTKLVVDAQANAMASLADGGWVDVYDGEKPESADEPIAKQSLGVSLRLGSPAFRSAVDGVIVANPIGSAVIERKIKATWARITRSDHNTAVYDISVGTKDANAIVPTVNLEPGVTFSISSLMHTVAKATPGV